MHSSDREPTAASTSEVVAAARSVVNRWRDVKRADDEIALLDVALSRHDAQRPNVVLLERDLIDELGKAAATFSDLRVALELLRHESMAMACGVAEEHVRSVIEEANRVRYAR
jgi:hypothetical protein